MDLANVEFKKNDFCFSDDEPFNVGDLVECYGHAYLWLGRLNEPIIMPGPGSWIAHYQVLGSMGLRKISKDWINQWQLISPFSSET